MYFYALGYCDIFKKRDIYENDDNCKVVRTFKGIIIKRIKRNVKKKKKKKKNKRHFSFKNIFDKR